MAQDALVKKIKHSPRIAPGAGMSQIARHSIRVVKSSPVLFSDTTAVNLFELPENVLVLGADVRVTAVFDASGTSAAATATITMPNDTGTVVLYDSNLTLLQATGFTSATAMELTSSTGGLVVLNYTAGTTTAGALEVYLRYVDYADEL